MPTEPLTADLEDDTPWPLRVIAIQERVLQGFVTTDQAKEDIEILIDLLKATWEK